MQKKEADGKLPFHERRVITLAQRGGDDRAFHGAAIHEDKLLRARLPAQTRLPDQAADLRRARFTTANPSGGGRGFPISRAVHWKQTFKQIGAV